MKKSDLNKPRCEKKLSPALRYAVFLRDNFTCLYCGKPATGRDTLTIDHVTPVAAGGNDDPSNLASCCPNCNSLKRDMSKAGYALYLRERGDDTRPMMRRLNRQAKKPIDLAAGAEAARAEEKRRKK